MAKINHHSLTGCLGKPVDSKIDISGPILDKLLSGTVENKSIFEKHLHNVLLVLGMTNDELLSYSPNNW